MAESDSPLSRSDRHPGISWDDMARADSRPVPDFLLGDSCPDLGSGTLSVDRYVDPIFFQRELEKMWPNVWQFAAREEDLIEPGSSIVFDNAGRSYVLIRQEDDSVRAFHNVCLHRGRRLRDQGGMVRELRCSFHAFTWNLDGSLKSIPCRWDFPQIEDEAMHLPEAEVGHWGGYIFIRENPGGPSLDDYLAPLPDHFTRWRHEDCFTATWHAKVVPANWKACAEAFMEAFHVIATHPQIMPFTGDANSKYFAWGDNVSLLLTPFGIPSPHVAHIEREPQWVIDQFLKNNSRVAPQGVAINAEPGRTVRETMGEYNRKRFSVASERDLDFASDSEMVDAFTYNVFPNFSPWGGFAPNIVYRWRPWPDQDHTLMEVRILNRLKPGQPRPPSPPMHLIPEDGTWGEHLGTLGSMLDQDMANIPAVQLGMKNSKTGQLHPGNYQEIKVRQLHRTLDKYLDAN